MAEYSKATRAIHKAGDHMMKALDRAKGSLADIPLGEEKLDPRTEKKRAAEAATPPAVDTTLTRLLYELRGKYQDTGGQE